MRSSAAVLLCLLFLTALSAVVHGVPETPLGDAKKNKFRDREATDDALGYPNIDEDSLLNSKCPRNLELRWQAEVSSSIYATPLIADINSDGKLEVVVPSFVHYLEVLEGSDGDKVPGWPAFHQSTVHSSPFLFDIDKDGAREIALATYNGEILFFRTSGYLMTEKLEVPRRRVRKDWYVGLNLDPANRSQPDVDDDSLVKKAANTRMDNNTLEAITSLTSPAVENFNSSTNVSKTDGEGKVNSTQPNIEIQTGMDNTTKDIGSTSTIMEENTTHSQRRLLEDSHLKVEEKGVSESTVAKDTEIGAATVENDGDLEEDADSAFDLFRDADEPGDEYDYDDYVDEPMWGDEDWIEGMHEKMEDFVTIDSHILCTPVIADIDNDGSSEMIVAVSYFFDREYYDNPEHSKELGDINIEKYVAGSIVVFNLDTKQVKWTRELDMSTDAGTYRAYIYSSPTVVDLDGDGKLDILVGTSFGLFYILDHHGNVRSQFPLAMAEIQAPVVAADINDDGKIEIVTADAHGNVAAWTAQGEEIWERHLKSLVPQANHPNLFCSIPLSIIFMRFLFSGYQQT